MKVDDAKQKEDGAKQKELVSLLSNPVSDLHKYKKM